MAAQPDRRHRELLLEAAIESLQTNGYARTSRDLVALSGTSPASIGYHFGSKEHLLNVAVTEAFQRWLKPDRACRHPGAGDAAGAPWPDPVRANRHAREEPAADLLVPGGLGAAGPLGGPAGGDG